MVVSDILQTKLTPPQTRSERVLRPRLMQHISSHLERPLMLVCAPAGYGKSSLLSESLLSSAMNTSLAWISLDEDDNDLTRFLTYLVAAFASPGIIDGDDLLDLLQSSQQPPSKVILTALISRLESLHHHVTLVLDDYHIISTPAVQEAMIFLLDHLPPQMCLIISSREDPPLPLARFRGRGQLAEIRTDDLRFTPDEAAQFLWQMLGIKLSPDQIKDLDMRTEGWIAGLQLAALAMKGREDFARFISAFTGSHRFILDYLIEEVLDRQLADIQTFLLETSILDRLNGALCDAVTTRRDGQQMLERIERNNLFLISLDDEGHWYRYHHLFAGMLAKRLRQIVQDEQIADLHRRASHWFAGENSIDEAMNHAIVAQDFDFAASLMESYSGQFNVGSWGNFAIKWVDQIPHDVLASHPLLALRVGLFQGQLGDGSLAENYLTLAQPALQSIETAEDDVLELKGHAYTLELMIANRHNNLEQAFLVAEKALQHLTDNQLEMKVHVLLLLGLSYDRKHQYEQAHDVYDEALRMAQALNDLVTLLTVMGQYTTSFLFEGRFHEAETQALALIEKAKAENQEYLPIVGNGYSLLAMTQLELNKLEQASISAQRGIELCEPFIPDGALICHTVLARLHHLSGDSSALQTAREIIQSKIDQFPLMAARISVPMLTHLWVIEDIFLLYREHSPHLEKFPKTMLYTQILVLEKLRALITENTAVSLSQAYAILDELQTLIPETIPHMCYLEMLILKTLVLDQDGRSDEALATLQTALTFGEPLGFVRIFLDAGTRFIQLLAIAKQAGICVDFIARLLAPTDNNKPLTSPAINAPTHSPPQTDLEPLSERELEILRLIADGASNREVAEELYISIGTVKKHLNNIFIKLDTHSRTQTIHIARQLNLL